MKEPLAAPEAGPGSHTRPGGGLGAAPHSQELPEGISQPFPALPAPGEAQEQRESHHLSKELPHSGTQALLVPENSQLENIPAPTLPAMSFPTHRHKDTVPKAELCCCGHKNFTAAVLALNNFSGRFLSSSQSWQSTGRAAARKKAAAVVPKGGSSSLRGRGKHLPGHCQGGLARAVLGGFHQLLLGFCCGTAFFPEGIRAQVLQLTAAFEENFKENSRCFHREK